MRPFSWCCGARAHTLTHRHTHVHYRVPTPPKKTKFMIQSSSNVKATFSVSVRVFVCVCARTSCMCVHVCCVCVHGNILLCFCCDNFRVWRVKQKFTAEKTENKQRLSLWLTEAPPPLASHWLVQVKMRRKPSLLSRSCKYFHLALAEHSPCHVTPLQSCDQACKRPFLVQHLEFTALMRRRLISQSKRPETQHQ